MKRVLFIMIAVAGLTAFLASCNDYETYGDKKEKERNAISKFISDSSIYVISEDQFKKQREPPGPSRNEFVKFNIMADSVTAWNITAAYAAYPDIMYVTRVGSTYTAAFLSGIMYSIYSASVPAGWLVPLSYVKIGRPQADDEDCAKVRLIVPHTQGHASASSSVTPYYYELTLQKEQ